MLATLLFINGIFQAFNTYHLELLNRFMHVLCNIKYVVYIFFVLQEEIMFTFNSWLCLQIVLMVNYVTFINTVLYRKNSSLFCAYHFCFAFYCRKELFQFASRQCWHRDRTTRVQFLWPTHIGVKLFLQKHCSFC